MFEQPVLPVCCRCVAVEHAHAKIPGGYSPTAAYAHALAPPPTPTR